MKTSESIHLNATLQQITGRRYEKLAAVLDAIEDPATRREMVLLAQDLHTAQHRARRDAALNPWRRW